MDQKVILGLLSIIVIGAVAVGVNNHVNNSTSERLPSIGIPEISAPISKTEIVLDEDVTLPDAPDKMMIYKAKSPEVTVDRVHKLAGKLGLESDISERDTKFVVKSGSLVLDVLKPSGRIIYGDVSKMYSGNVNNPPNLPPEKSALETAKEFLRGKGLMPPDAEFSRVVVDSVEIARKDNTGEVSTERVDLTMQVRFRRKINNSSVAGAGSKLKVYIGDNGNVVGVYKCWREYEPYKKFNIRTPEEAFGILKEKGVHSTVTGENVKVEGAHLAYYTQPAIEKQKYLQPVYVFEVNTGGRDGCKEYIPAVSAT